MLAVLQLLTHAHTHTHTFALVSLATGKRSGVELALVMTAKILCSNQVAGQCDEAVKRQQHVQVATANTCSSPQLNYVITCVA